MIQSMWKWKMHMAVSFHWHWIALPTEAACCDPDVWPPPVRVAAAWLRPKPRWVKLTRGYWQAPVDHTQQPALSMCLGATLWSDHCRRNCSIYWHIICSLKYLYWSSLLSPSWLLSFLGLTQIAGVFWQSFFSQSSTGDSVDVKYRNSITGLFFSVPHSDLHDWLQQVLHHAWWLFPNRWCACWTPEYSCPLQRGCIILRQCSWQIAVYSQNSARV